MNRESRPLGGTSRTAGDLAGASIANIFALPEPDRSRFQVDVLPPVVVVNVSDDGFEALRRIWRSVGDAVGVVQVRLVVGTARPLPYLRDELEQRSGMQAHLRIQVEADSVSLTQEWCDALLGAQ